MDNPSVGQYSREVSANNRAYFVRMWREMQADRGEIATEADKCPSSDKLLKLQAKFRRSVQSSLAKECKS